MKRATLVLVIVLGLLFAGASPVSARAPEPSAVTPWIEFELTTIASHRVNPPRASRALAYVSRAMYLAALAGGTGRDDAVAGAASTVLEHFFPDEASNIDKLADELADPTSSAFRRGIGVGRLLIARAERDGSDAVWTGTPPKGDAFWVPTPPGNTYPPLEPLAGEWRTWNLEEGSQFRPGPPPEYGSSQFLAEMNEVYQISQTLTDEQKRIADYWADGAGTVTPARSLGCHRHRPAARRRLVNPPHRAALRGAEHSASGCLHRVLGHQVHVLVNSTDHRDPAVDRRRLALLHLDTAIPLLCIRPFNDVRCCLNGSLGLLPRTERGAC
jgi:hypothetical protein